MKFRINGTKLPKFFLGTSPFIGASQFGDKSRKYREFWLKKPKNLEKIFEMAGEMDVGVQAIAYPEILTAIKNVGVDCLVSAGVRDFNREMERIGEIDVKGVLLHASRVDDRKIAEIKTYIELITDMGLMSGIATHNPSDTIPEILSLEGVEIIMAPINEQGIFMYPNRDSVIERISLAKKAGKIIIAMKPLGGGRLPLKALKFPVENSDGVAVGIGEFKEFKETFDFLFKLVSS
jgi:hypothetical protein